MTSLALLLLRATVGGLLIGHGGQKLWGWFGGAGIDGTAGWLASLRLTPPRQWALLAGASEFGGGLLTLLGLLNPVGPLLAAGAMLTAWVKVHLGKPIWVTAGGAELPLTNLAILAAISLRGPGKLSLDKVFGIRTPTWVVVLTAIGVGAGVVVATKPELAEDALPIGATDARVEGDPSMDVADQEELRLASDVDEPTVDAGALSGVDIAATGRSEA